MWKLFVSELVVLDDDVISCHGFIGFWLLWLVIICESVDVVMSSSDDGVLSIIWRLVNIMSLISLFVVLRYAVEYCRSRLMSVVCILSLVSDSVSEGFILYH